MTYFDHTFGGKHVRSVVLDGVFWFVASDVCRCLGISNSRDALTGHSADEKQLINIGSVGSTDRTQSLPSHKPNLGGNPNVNCVNEPGLYRLIFQSRKKKAEEFKRWVLHDVLPTLRAYGSYDMADMDTTANPDPANVGEVYDPFEAIGADKVNDRLGFIREARMIHGKKAAAELWVKMGFPVFVPLDEAPYPDRQNHVSDFINDACFVTGGDEQIMPCDLYQGYVEWCKSSRHSPLNKAAFFRRMAREAGRAYDLQQGGVGTFAKRKSSSTYYQGIMLRAEYMTDRMRLMD
ncbi:BRO family protein [Lentilitoribacter sp. EG35]|uniref:BRO family protein n=1 Tax=Lentilitoribacter sp. EG35 TaxID=3234192 RepID=UPI00345FCAB2